MKNTGKRIMSVLCAIAIVLSLAALPGFSLEAKAAEGLDLTAMQIVVAADANEMEHTAALELRNFIYEMTGVTLAKVTEGENSGAGIYIGPTKYAKAKGVTYPTENDGNKEAWAIQAVDGNLVLTGAEQRGTIYAVYHLLEDVLGVRWWNFWERHVPVGSAIVPADYADSGVPAMEYREIFVGTENNTNYTFYAFNRINGYTTHTPPHYGDNEVYGGPTHVHNFNKYFTADDFAAHPEWFSMDESGQRVSNRQLCLTNPELKQEFAKRLLAYVKKDPGGLFAICPNDNKYLCDCESCTAAIEKYNGSGYVLDFVNEMARAVTAAGYDDATIEMLVYWAYVEVPKEIVPEPNVMLRIANNDMDILHGINHPNNAEILERTKTWAQLGSNDLYYWQYVVNYYNNGITPSMFYFDDDFATLMELGVNGWFAEQENAINTEFWDMKLWLIAKMMEEPVFGEEYEALMDEFIFGYYGEEAGKYIRDYLYYADSKTEPSDAYKTFGGNVIDAEWLTVEDIITCVGYFDQAYEAAGNDELLRRRVRCARMGVDRVAYENYDRWLSEAEEAGLTLPFGERELGERLSYAFAEQIALRGNYDNGIEKYASRYDQYAEDMPALPAELADVEEDHVFVYEKDDFRLTQKFALTADDASVVGKAVSGEMGSVLSKDGSILVALYNPNGGGEQVSLIGQIPSQEIAQNGEYGIYQLNFTVPKMGSGGYMYMTDSWGIQILQMANHMQKLEGENVQIYLSMRSEGGKFYLDRVLMLPESYNAAHSYVRRDHDGMGMCQICGDVVESDDPRIAENTEKPGKEQNQGSNQNGLLIGIIAAIVVVDIAVVVLLIVILKKRKKAS